LSALLTFLITVDVDQDGMALQNERNVLSWEAVNQIPAIAALFHDRRLPVTWFVRADNQLSDLYGSAAYLHRRFEPLWDELRLAGDELAWHPHLYQRDAAGSYGLDFDDARCAAKLRAIAAELRDAGLWFDVVRIGEGRHGDALMRTLCDLGARIDCSAIPGRQRRDSERFFDWLPTPQHPYRPSAADYRTAGEDPLPIVELPIAVVDIQADYDSRPLRRYLNLAYRPALLRDAFERWLDSADGVPRYLQTLLHPEETCGGANGLYERTLEAVARNIDTIMETAGRRGISTRAETIPRLVPELEEMQARAPV
jgi:hypothetical protein